MKSHTKIILLAAVVASAGVLVAWQATGGDYYTKYQIVEQVEQRAAADDPLAATGFYDSEASQTTTVTRDEFRLGLLPTPNGVFDKHAVSVSSLLGMTWAIAGVAIWVVGRRRRNLTGGGQGIVIGE